MGTALYYRALEVNVDNHFIIGQAAKRTATALKRDIMKRRFNLGSFYGSPRLYLNGLDGS